MSYAESCIAHYTTLPLQLMPQELRNRTAALTLNAVFAKELQQGELDFLEGQQVRLALSDATLDVTVALINKQIHAVLDKSVPTLTVNGTIYDYLLLITGREDPDTLFFQRRLTINGNTGLGVHLKNFLAAIDPTNLPLGNLVQPAVSQCLDIYEWWM